MRFKVLGPLEVVSDTDVLALPTGRAQAVLAMLVLHGNRAVSMERLIEAAWGGDGSPTARTQVHGYISSLRRALASRWPGAAGAGDRLVTRASGYALLVSEGESDVETFHAQVVKAREARSYGDQVKAIELFTEALALWRGRAFEGISSPILEAEAELLGQARLAALEECARIELDLGRHGEVLVRLARLTETNPLHEGLHELLMLTLYRSGRRAEALAAYNHLRRTLLDELGVEPSQRLRALLQQMLVEDPDLFPQDPPATQPRPRPAQLPADVSDFTGREQQISLLSDLLAGRPAAQNEGVVLVSAITGAGGIGKTSLAVHVAHQLDARFSDGQLYVDLRGTGPAAREPADVLGDILRDLGVPDTLIPDEEDPRSALYRSIVAGRTLLIVLDNARDSAQVRPLLPGSGDCRVLVTSRNRMPGLICSRLDLDVLPPAEAQALFTAIVGDRAEAEPEATEAVLAVCGGLPLAIRIAGARLVSRPGWSVAGFAARLADQRRLLDELHVDDLAVRASFDVSYASLGRAAEHGADPAEHRSGPARAFCFLGLFRGPEISLPAAAALLGQTRADTETSLEHLVDSSLLDSPAHGRYRMHDLLGVYATGLATRDLSGEESRDAIERLTHWYLSGIVAADKVLWPHLRRPPALPADPRHPAPGFSTLNQALQWLDLERPALIEVAQLAWSHRLDELASLISVFASGYYLRRGHWLDWLSVNEIGLRSARRIGERAREARLLTSRGIALGNTHVVDQAVECFAAALEIWAEVDDPAGRASTQVNLGTLLKHHGRYAEALACLTQALALARLAGIRSTEAAALGNLGTCHDRLGDYAAALSLQEASLAICREIGNRDGESTALMNIGEVYLHSSRPDEALSCLRQALAITRSTHGRYDEALVLTNLGKAMAALGRTADAHAHLNQALTIWRALDDPQVSAVETLIASLPAMDPALGQN